MDWSRVDQALVEASVPFESAGESDGTSKRKFVFPGAVLLVARGGEILFYKGVGCRSLLPAAAPMTKDIVFDIASLTKALATTTLVMRFVDNGQLEVDRRLSRIFQTFGTQGREKMTLRHLLNHTSGFPAVYPFYKDVVAADRSDRAGILTSRGAVEMVYRALFDLPLENMPGGATVYSDLGYILLGYALEMTSGGQYLDKLVQKHIVQPLGLRSFAYIDLSKIRRRGFAPITDMIAATAECPWRGRVMCGEVHDDNAWAMGGIAGHAGIFSTAPDVHAIARELIECYHGRGNLVSRETVRRFWTRDGLDANSTWALGWDTPSSDNSAAGRYFSPQAVGHLGYTGCSIWIDPEPEVEVILLTNRVHPSTSNNAIREFRPKIHDLVMETLGLAK